MEGETGGYNKVFLKVGTRMMSTLNLAIGQPEESPEKRILQEYRGELERLRELILYKRNQRKIPLDSLDEIERGLSLIIQGLDRLLRSATLVEDIRLAVEKVQISVRKARKSLLIASSLLERPRTQRSLEVLYEKYEEFTDLLLEAIEQLDI